MGNLPLPPLNPTRVFEVAGRVLSVTKAAEELFVTPTAVSRQIQALERSLGVKLFHRSSTGLELTEAGSLFLSEAGPALRALADAASRVREGKQAREELVLRSPATFAVRWLIPRLSDFHRRYPSVTVRLTTSLEPVDFSRERIDAGIRLGAGDWPGIRRLRLLDNVLVPVAAPGIVHDLTSATLLHSMARPDDWGLWSEASGCGDVDSSSGMRYETSLLAYQAAIEGQGVAIAQRALVEAELRTGALVPVSEAVLDRGDWTYYFTWPDRPRRNDALSLFASWLVSLVREPNEL